MARELDDLAELVDDPNERLSAEYKALVDFNVPEARAKLARHIAALANHGGGYIVLGFNDDLTPAAAPMVAIDRDKVAAVVKTYLEPAIQCDVREVTARTGRVHPVIVIPPHGPTPICARADGPQDAKGRVQGIARGVHYIRKAGPASDQILTAAEWGPLIRRCALAERTSILGAIDAALRGENVEKLQLQRLQTWHAAALNTYEAAYKTHGAASDVAARRYQFSYLIDPADGGPAVQDLKGLLERAAGTVDEKIQSGWGMFHIFHGQGGAAFATASEVDSGETDFLETNFIQNDSSVGATDLWRFAADGRATLLRGFWEDSRLTRYNIVEGQVFSPNSLVQDLAEFVLHASTVAAAFPGSARILFRCEWVGLKGRTLYDPSARWMFSGHTPNEDRRLAKADVTVGEATNDWFQVVATLAGPVARAFGIGHVITADWIAGQAPTWKHR